MDAFPFTDDEWNLVIEASWAVMDATLADDSVLRQSLMIELEGVLGKLRDRYGDHPVLIETEADFQDEPIQQIELYRYALKLAVQHELPTYTIRISLAGVLLDDFGDSEEAAIELAACRDELDSLTDDWYRKQWSDLLSRCPQR